MNRVTALLASALAASAPPIRATSLSPSALNQRHVAGCMSKQMAANKTLSYNQASKICKELIKQQRQNLANDAPKTAAGR